MRLALAQTEPLWEDKEGNFRAALRFLEQARNEGADMILFPEMSMTGFSMHPEKIGETADNPVTLRFFREQAEKYGHSQRRELAFLVAHSMLHLCGYDHMEEEERLDMEARQRAILDTRGYSR